MSHEAHTAKIFHQVNCPQEPPFILHAPHSTQDNQLWLITTIRVGSMMKYIGMELMVNNVFAFWHAQRQPIAYDRIRGLIEDGDALGQRWVIELPEIRHGDV